MRRAELAVVLETLYERYNRPKLIHPDPLECVYRYADPLDREVTGLVAATLAYGRVGQILRSVDAVLGPLGASPRRCLLDADEGWLDEQFGTFQHRWTRGPELAGMLAGIRRVLLRHGSIEACFLAHQGDGAETTMPGLEGLCGELNGCDGTSSLVSDPARGSACKRLHLYLRWMVRDDDVDPGCWRGVSPRLLVVPLDTHMHRVARSLRMTRRKQASLRAALDMTRVFRRMRPDDPVRYDFALTRMGIRPEMDLTKFLEEVRRVDGGKTDDSYSVLSRP